MDITTSNNSILTSVSEDVNQIISGGAQLPSRDASGKRFFNQGELKVLRTLESKVRQMLNSIKKALNELKIGEATRKMLGNELEKATMEYAREQQADEAELAKVNAQIEQLEQEIASRRQTNYDEAPKQEVKKRKMNGLLSFLLVAFIAEFVAFFATFNLQQENLSTDAIWWRLVYIGVIYVYTIILYIKYVKVRTVAVKGLLVGCILLGFICLLHAMAVTFLNLDVVNATSAGFDLNQIESIEEEANKGVLFDLISKPGLLEFLVATLLVFIGEIVTIDGKKGVETKTTVETGTMPLSEMEAIDFEAIAQQNTFQHITILKEKQTKLSDRCNKRTAEFNERVNAINAQLEANEQKMELAKMELEKYRLEMDALFDRVLSDLANYRKLLLKDLAFRLGTDTTSFKYELVTKEDVLAYYNIQSTYCEE